MSLEILTVEQLAELLKCSDKTVRDRATELGGVKIGRDWIFPAGAVSRRLEELALAPSPKPQTPAQPTAVLHAVPASKRPRGLPVLPKLQP